MKTKSASILVVDDDRENGRFLQEQLSQNGCKVIWHSDPRKALQQARKGSFQIGILDLKMPHMNGVELYHKL